MEVRVHADVTLDTHAHRELDLLKLAQGDIAPLRHTHAEITEAEEDPVPIKLL